MAQALGWAAGGGMLVLIAILFCAFLMQIRVLPVPGFLRGRDGERKSAAIRRRPALWRAVKTAGAVIAAACVQWLMAGLLRRVLFEGKNSLTDLTGLFAGSLMQRMADAMTNPRAAAVYRLPALPGAWLGEILHAPPFPCGAALCVLSTAISLCFVTARMEKRIGETKTDRALILFLCFPGSVLFFLPGWPAAALLPIALVFFGLTACRTQSTPPKHGKKKDAGFGWIVGTEAVLSCAVIAGMVWGRIG